MRSVASVCSSVCPFRTLAFASVVRLYREVSSQCDALRSSLYSSLRKYKHIKLRINKCELRDFVIRTFSKYEGVRRQTDDVAVPRQRYCFTAIRNLLVFPSFNQRLVIDCARASLVHDPRATPVRSVLSKTLMAS